MRLLPERSQTFSLISFLGTLISETAFHNLDNWHSHILSGWKLKLLELIVVMSSFKGHPRCLPCITHSIFIYSLGCALVHIISIDIGANLNLKSIYLHSVFSDFIPLRHLIELLAEVLSDFFNSLVTKIENECWRY